VKLDYYLNESTRWSRSDGGAFQDMPLAEFRVSGWWQGRSDRAFRSGENSEAEVHSEAPSRRSTP